MNALSQYNHLCYFSAIDAARDELARRIREFFSAAVQPRLAGVFSECVVDFAIVGETVWVIEINPFLVTTDGCLFNWDTDRPILEHGPFTLRVVGSPPAGATTMLAPEWRALLAL